MRRRGESEIVVVASIMVMSAIVGLTVYAVGAAADQEVRPSAPRTRLDWRDARIAELEAELEACRDEAHPVRIYQSLHAPAGFDDGAEAAGILPAITVHGNAIDRDNDAIWDGPETLDRWLDRVVPVDFDGPLVLDWEGRLYKVLEREPGDVAREKSIASMIELATHVRAVRPEALVSFYSIPTRRYWSQDEAWRESMLELGDRLRPHVHAFTLSVYDFYDDDNERDARQYAGLVRVALEMADGEIPVGIYVWCRRHPSNRSDGFSLIGAEEYVEHVRAITSVRHNGRRVEHVIAWGATAYYFNKRSGVDARIARAKMNEVPGGMSVDRYVAEILHPELYRRLRVAVPHAE